MAAVSHSFFSHPLTPYRDVFADSPCISQETSGTIQKIALGVLTALIELPISSCIESMVIWTLKSYGITLTASQIAMKEFDDVFALSISSSNIFSKGVKIAEIVILAPILEEFLFRYCLHFVLEDCATDPNTTTSKIVRIVANSVIFGACHLHPAQGWTNVPIFIGTFFGGCILSALREYTGDIIAPTAMHMTHNGIEIASHIYKMRH